MHIFQSSPHQGMDQSPAGIFRIGCHTGDAAHIHDRVIDIDLHGINHDHRCQLFFIKPSQSIGLCKNRTFGGFDLILLPAGLEQIIGGDLKGILEQGVKLFQIIFIQLTHSEVPVCLKISMFFLFHFKRLPF